MVLFVGLTGEEKEQWQRANFYNLGALGPMRAASRGRCTGKRRSARWQVDPLRKGKGGGKHDHLRRPPLASTCPGERKLECVVTMRLTVRRT